MHNNKPIPFWLSLAEDLKAHIGMVTHTTGRVGHVWIVIRSILFSSSFHLTVLYRVEHSLIHYAGLLGKIVSDVIFWFCRHWYCVSIKPTARIYGGVVFPHPQSIVIGEDAVIGKNARIFQNVTIGGVPDKRGMPVIDDECHIYAGAVVVGPIYIGKGVSIGANTVVSSNIPDFTFVRGAKPDINFTQKT